MVEHCCARSKHDKASDIECITFWGIQICPREISRQLEHVLQVAEAPPCPSPA